MGSTNSMKINPDYKQYVGGEFDLMSDWQMQYLTQNAKITPDTKFLDLGCGSMRLGRKLIPFLNTGCYTGLDMCEEIVKKGIQSELHTEILNTKKPKFIYTSDFDMSECDPVDFVWACAVFNHLKPETIKKCLTQLNTVCNKETVFYFTYWPGDRCDLSHSDVYNGIENRDFYHTEENMLAMLAQHGWQGEPQAEKQIRGQSIIRATRI